MKNTRVVFISPSNLIFHSKISRPPPQKIMKVKSIIDFFFDFDHACTFTNKSKHADENDFKSAIITDTK